MGAGGVRVLLLREHARHLVRRAVGAGERWQDEALFSSRNVRWVDREGRPGTRLVEYLKSLEVPEGATCYVTGEAWLCAVVTSHLSRERKIDASRIRAMPH